MDNINIKQKIDELIELGNEIEFSRNFVESKSIEKCQNWFSKTIAIILKLTDEKGFFYTEALNIIRNSKRQGGIHQNEVSMLIGLLKNLSESIDNGFTDNYYISEKKMTDLKADNKTVFVVHGRNLKTRKAMFQFLRSLHLQPLEWSQAVEKTGKASPYVGEILDTAFSIAQAAIILLTPDDEAQLKEEYRGEKEPAYETELTGQARPNVIFEAGMAMGMYPERTILVEFGDLRPISDITGRHVIRMNNSVSRRQELAQRLKTAGCDVNLSGTDWHEDGDFEVSNDTSKKKHHI